MKLEDVNAFCVAYLIQLPVMQLFLFANRKSHLRQCQQITNRDTPHQKLVYKQNKEPDVKRADLIPWNQIVYIIILPSMHLTPLKCTNMHTVGLTIKQFPAFPSWLSLCHYFKVGILTSALKLWKTKKTTVR